LLIVALALTGTTIWVFKSQEAPEKVFGFPSAVGQSLTYGIYENDNKIGVLTQTVIGKTHLTEYFKVEIRTPEENTLIYVDGNGHLKDIRDRVMASGRMEMWQFDHRNGVIRVQIGNEKWILGEFGMPENFIPEWEIYYSRFGREFLSSDYSKQFTTVGRVSIFENYLHVIYATWTASVVSEETVTTPAGIFSCRVVKVMERETGKNLFIWIDKQLRITVQWELGGYITKLENYSGFS